MTIQTTGYTRSLINVAHVYKDYRLHVCTGYTRSSIIVMCI